MKTLRNITMIFASIALFASCTSISKSMRDPNTRVNFNKNDFSYSEQVTGEASSTKILMVDWERLFKKTTGNVDAGAAAGLSLTNLPIIGNLMNDATSSYALYNLMEATPGYDVIFYPQYEIKVERPALGIGFLYKKTEVKVKARLGKINK
jgi:hypothetical protein